MLDDLPVNANIDMVETNIDSDLTVKSDHHLTYKSYSLYSTCILIIIIFTV